MVFEGAVFSLSHWRGVGLCMQCRRTVVQLFSLFLVYSVFLYLCRDTISGWRVLYTLFCILRVLSVPSVRGVVSSSQEYEVFLARVRCPAISSCFSALIAVWYGHL